MHKYITIKYISNILTTDGAVEHTFETVYIFTGSLTTVGYS